jgi:hypothetical protein
MGFADSTVEITLKGAQTRQAGLMRVQEQSMPLNDKHL